MLNAICCVLITMELIVMIYSTVRYLRLIKRIRAEAYTPLSGSKNAFFFTTFCMLLFVVTYALALIYVIFNPVDPVYLFVTIICAFGAFFSVSMVASQRDMFLMLTQKTNEVMRAFVNAAELKDPRTFGHSQQVRNLTELFYNALPGELKSQLSLPKLLDAAYLHDIGKLGIPNSILNKEDPLTNEEWALIHSHPKMGANMLRNTCFEQISDWVLYHHERPDGGGYYGLKDSEIPLESKIILIADTYSAMTGKRSYRKCLTHEEAIKVMLTEAGRQFDEELVEYFSMIPRGEFVRIESDLSVGE